MDLEDNTTVLTTLKSFNSFISSTEPPQRLSEHSAGTGNLQTQYKHSMELLEAGERLHSQNLYLQLDQEKKQMVLSHKRARFELEKAASDSARDLEHEVDRNQDLLGRIKKLEDREKDTAKNLSEQMETNRSLRNNLDGLNRKLEERDTRLNSANQTISSCKDEIRELKQRIQNQDLKISSQNLENQELQEQLDLQRRKYQEVSQQCQSLQAAQTSCSEHVFKIKELERHLALQEQDMAIVKTVKSEVAKVPGLEKELKRLRDDNAFLRESRENCSLLKEEVEGLRKKLERMEKTKEELVNMELEKERLAEKLKAWENLGQSTGLNIRKPEDLSREVIQIQQREIALKEQNYTLNSRVRSVERSQSELQAELTQQRGKTLEEQKKRETQDSLVRRLQKRVLLLTKERDGMRSILESYDSELASNEYSPQLSKRLREAEDILQKTQNHSAEMEIQLTKAQEETGALKLQLQAVELELESVKKQQASAADSISSVAKEEVSTLRQKIEDLEAERQRLEEQNNILEMRLERHNLQGDYDPVKTRVLHFKMNPTSEAKQQRQQDVESLREEVTSLRELVRSLQEGGAQAQSQDDSSMNISGVGLSLPPSKEVLDLRKQMESSELRNQRLKEVFQRKIQEFRTVCYLLTGYQIDITTENQYRLSSVYAEHMDDSLLFKKDQNPTLPDKASPGDTGSVSSPGGMSPICSQASTPLVKRSPKKTLQLPSPPEYVVYTDSELEQVRKHYFEMVSTGREGECIMSKELRCRLVRNTITSMISILRASQQGEEVRYPTRHEVTAMARRLVEYYPMLRDEDKTHLTIFKNLLKRLQNVKSPQKRQGATPERGHSKKRRQIDFSSSDKEGEDYDADSSGGSTIILHQISGSSSDDGPSPLESKDSPATQARHYNTLQAMYKKPKPNQDAVSQLLDLEFEARRAFIDCNVLKEEDRPTKILDAYPCFKELHHVMDELRRILDKGNKKFTEEVKKRWEEFCAKVQFYGVSKKVMKPPVNMDRVEQAIELVRSLPTLFPSPAAPPKKIGHASEALLHVLQSSSGSMQLMETEFSKTLEEMVSLHLHHQKSIPAFLSAVTLDLFSRQTVI